MFLKVSVFIVPCSQQKDGIGQYQVSFKGKVN